MPAVRACAPAKINPRLDVLGKRADGYHEVETFLLAIDLEDALTAEITTHGRIRLTLAGSQLSPDIPSDARNLAVRAAESALELARARGRARATDGVDLHLEKRIPSQSGLGGASSDAAAAWLSTMRLFDVAIDPRERDAALAALGSDTVFFAAASSGAAWCTGRGEIVEPAPSPRDWTIALVVPAVVCPTAQVYRAFSPPLSRAALASRVPRSDWTKTPPHAARAHLGNSLEPAALTAVPGLAPWRALLDELGLAHFRLSGSGSAHFGLYAEPAHATDDLRRIQALAGARGLALRFAGLVRPSGHAARVRHLG